jgi:hypothetical protein
VCVDCGEELGRQPRLADASVTDHRHQLAPLLRADLLPRFPQPFELAHSPDEKALVSALRRLVHGDQPEGGHRPLLPLQLQRGELLRFDRLVHECERRLSDQHLVGLGRLLEARGDVDRVAGREPLLGPGHDLARVHTNPRLHTERRQSVPHLHGRPDGTQSVVLVHPRHAKHRHHRITDELLEGASVPLDDRPHPPEIAGKQRTNGLRIGHLAERGRLRHVAEQHRDRLTLLTARSAGLQLRAAVGTEGKIALALAPTAGTDQHQGLKV